MFHAALRQPPIIKPMPSALPAFEFRPALEAHFEMHLERGFCFRRRFVVEQRHPFFTFGMRHKTKSSFRCSFLVVEVNGLRLRSASSRRPSCVNPSAVRDFTVPSGTPKTS